MSILIGTNSDVLTYVRQMVEDIHGSRSTAKLLSKKTYAAIAEHLGIEPGKLDDIRYEAPQLTLDQLRRIMDGLRDIAVRTPDRHLSQTILSGIQDIKASITKDMDSVFLDGGHLFGNMLQRYLNIPLEEQNGFAKIFSGIYLIIRFSKKGFIVVAAMTIAPGAGRIPIASFSTRRWQSNGDERFVDGYIYKAGNYIMSLGRVRGTSYMRYAMLEPFGGNKADDMIGLRLSISTSDDGQPFAHRIYCKKMHVNVPPVEILRRHRNNKKERHMLRKHIVDLDDILKYLQEDGATRGLGMPTVRG